MFEMEQFGVLWIFVILFDLFTYFYLSLFTTDSIFILPLLSFIFFFNSIITIFLI